MSRKRTHRAPPRHQTYTQIDELLACPLTPLPAEKRRHQLLRMYQGLAALEKGETPRADDWRCVADAVNLLETLVRLGEVRDSTGLLADATAALAFAGARHVDHGLPLRLSGPGIAAVRAVLADYAACLDALPARVVIRAHRQTERRMQAILAGQGQPHDVRIVQVPSA